MFVFSYKNSRIALGDVNKKFPNILSEVSFDPCLLKNEGEHNILGVDILPVLRKLM